ncbi:MAG: AI-2E family transporter [Candidatus Pacebacteria bacterium]|nr:AI-2E family transporter [Candidatus Paceibacterota bacterium]
MAKEESKILKIDITWQGIFRVILALFSFYIIYLIKDVIILIVLSLVISILLNPAIDIIEKKNVKRPLATLIVYISAALLIASFFLLTIPPIFIELTSFSKNYSEYFNNLAPYFNNYLYSGFDFSQIDSSFQDGLMKLTSELWAITTAIFNIVFSIITIFTLAFFFSMEEKEIVGFIKLFSPKKLEDNIVKSWERGRITVSQWFASRIFVSFLLAIMTFIGCLLLKIKFAVSLSLLAGFLNIIPVVGPITSAILICLVAAMNSWTIAFLALIMVFVTQQIEGNIFTPLTTNKMVGLPNFLILASILVGGKLVGIVGMVLAIPIAGIMYETFKNYIMAKKAKIN